RGGDFLYSDDEFTVMKNDVALCKHLGCDGIVTGILNRDGTVDTERCGQLVNLAYPLGVTFHRAFDRTADPFKALEEIIEMGCERILTSGQTPSINDGLDLVSKLIAKSEERIIIMPGSGVRAGNIAELAARTNATEFHTSARTTIQSNMDFRSEKMNEDLKIISVDEQEVRNIKEILSTLS
ncbi:MAG: copper homeostasis protein CutC, partial [Ferruginibacter sp.]